MLGFLRPPDNPHIHAGMDTARCDGVIVETGLCASEMSSGRQVRQAATPTAATFKCVTTRCAMED
jgi:hypothetical protein